MSTILILGIVGLLVCIFCPDTKNTRLWVCVAGCIFFIFHAGFRDFYHNINDTLNYLNSYNKLLDQSLEQVLSDNTFDFNLDDYSKRDPGYYVFVKLTQLIFPDFVFFLFIVAVIISIPMTWIIYKFTDSVPAAILGILIYQALFSNFFETGIRQTIAMGIIYSSLPFVMRRQWLPHYLLLILAYFFHSSALIFIPFYLLCQLNIDRKYLLLAILVTPVIMAFSKDMIGLVSEGTMFEQYGITEEDNDGTPVFSVVLFMVAVGTWIFSKRIDSKNIKNRMMLVGLICSLALMPSSWINSNFIRLVFYYLVFLMPLIPKIIECISPIKDTRNILYLITGSALVFLSMQQGY